MPELPIGLHAANTERGILQHVFIAETFNPEQQNVYSLSEAERSFNAMKSTIFNRLKTPRDFGAPGATSIIDIVTAPRQFEGFTKNAAGNVVVGTQQQTVIYNVLSFANYTNHPRRANHLQFVEKAITISKGTGISDEFVNIKDIGGTAVTGGVFGWNKGAPIGEGLLKYPLPLWIPMELPITE